MNMDRNVFGRAFAFLALSITLGSLLPVSQARAQSGEGGWYLGANIPLMFIDDTESVTGGENFAPIRLGYEATTLNEYDTGYKIGGSFGYAFESGLRIEVEGFHASAEVSKLFYNDVAVPTLNFQLTGSTELAVSGSASQTAAMLNVWYDFDTAGQWTPYIGAGYGQLEVDFGDVEYDTNGLAQVVANAISTANNLPIITLPPGFVPKLSPKDTTTAWHIGGGVGWELSDSTLIQLGYRYQASGDIEFSGLNENASVNAFTEQKTHFIELGIRYRL